VVEHIAAGGIKRKTVVQKVDGMASDVVRLWRVQQLDTSKPYTNSG
jgi:hypothetical protein